MLDAAGLSPISKRLLWSQAFQMASDIYNISTSQKHEKTKWEKWNKQMPRWCKKLRAFGDIGIVKKTGKAGHIEEKGFEGMMVGYCDDSAEEVYKMLNLATNRVSTARDVRWLNKSFGEFMKEGSE